MAEITGKIFGDFCVGKLIGKGNMADVYLAEQISLQRNVALKILKLQCSEENAKNEDSDNTVERFMREGRLAASIQHKNIVGIYSLGKENDHCYIAMEYISGPSLEALVTEKPISEETTWFIGQQVSEALQAALVKDIIHRDIKPANIMVDDSQIKVTDFGLSKRQNGNCNITQNNIILGTPNYMSIEQAEGKKIDFRSDIYSLGVTLYRTLTGKLLFSSNSVLDVLYKHKYEKAIDPSEIIPNISYKSSLVIAKMLQKQPQDRYQSYEHLLCDINCVINQKNLMHANINDATSVYVEKPAQKTVFTKTSQITKRMVANVQNIIERETNKTQKPENTGQNIKTRGHSVDTMRSPVTKKFFHSKHQNRHLQTNIEHLEKKIGKLFSQFLIDKEVLSPEKLHQASSMYLNLNSTFGEISVSEGMLSPPQVRDVLKVQKKIKKTFGQLTMQMGLLNEKQVQEVLDIQDRLHVGFYDVLLRENFVDKKTLDQQLLNFTKLALKNDQS